MLDIQFIREHTDIVKESQRKRGESVELVDEVLSSDTARREALKAFEEARAQQKEIGKKVASAPADEKAKLIAETKEPVSYTHLDVYKRQDNAGVETEQHAAERAEGEDECAVEREARGEAA